jgi:hypothetical protein
MFAAGLTIGLSPGILICALFLSANGLGSIPSYLVRIVSAVIFPGSFLVPLLPIGYGLWRKGAWDWFSVGAGLALAIIVVAFFALRLFAIAAT